MTLEVLISAMNQKDMQIAKTANCHSDVVIINQTDNNSYMEERSETTIRMYSTTERGLAKSRNMAIKFAKGDICLLCDDDEHLVDGYDKIIISAFKTYPKADIIAFDMIREKSDVPKRYKKLINYGKTTKVTKAQRFKTYLSVQIAFRRKKIIDNDLLFDERFGSGSGKIAAGEETVWQVAAKKKGLSIIFVPEIITYVRQDNSKWFRGLNEQYYYDLGACLGINYPLACHILKYYYVLFIKGTKLSRLVQIKWLRLGIREFQKNGYSYREYCMIKGMRE